MLLVYLASVSCGENTFLRGLNVTQRAQRHLTGRVWTLIVAAAIMTTAPLLSCLCVTFHAYARGYPEENRETG